jgi:hypothetical protein
MKRYPQLFSRFGLIALGVSLGLFARVVFGPPDAGMAPERSIDRPLPNNASLEDFDDVLLPIDMPISNRDK